jgi:Prolipoprotein diacylglyceryl transferase.
MEHFLFCSFFLQNRLKNLSNGFLAGVFLILCFGGRFIIEFWKSSQDGIWDGTLQLQTGQYLSIPFIALGLYLIFSKTYRNPGIYE